MTEPSLPDGILPELFSMARLPDETADHDDTAYSVVRVPGFDNWLVGLDADMRPCLLVDASSADARRPPIRLEGLEVTFARECRVAESQGITREGRFTIVCCSSENPQVAKYFMAVCETLILSLGVEPQDDDVAEAVHNLAILFRQLTEPSRESVIGVFGELFVIWLAADRMHAVAAWRSDDSARFDFATGRARLEVKATAGRVRKHSFSYEQCNPSADMVAALASMLVERVSVGQSMESMVREIADSLGGNRDLLFKLYDTLAKTLGSSLPEALQTEFDLELAQSSLDLYDLRDIPAIRGSIPEGVSEVRFTVDLSGSPTTDYESLTSQEENYRKLLPH